MDAKFIETGRERLFAVVHRGQPGAPVFLHSPAFAEEMNRCRNHVARAARAMAAAGASVVILDPAGTGDSDGDFANLTVDRWRADLATAANWIRAEFGMQPVLWGHRLGATIALSALNTSPNKYSGLLLWAPILSGETFLKQFLRIRTSANFGRDGEAQETISGLLARLEAGDTINVGGYAISPALAVQIRALSIAEPPATPLPCTWIEATASLETPLAPAVSAIWERWTAALPAFTHERVAAPLFWNQVEPEPAPALIDATATIAKREFQS